MNLPHPLGEPLSDEAAAHTLKLLHDLTDAFACQYFPQVRRYYDALSHRPDLERTCHDGQLDLFEDADVPF